MPHVTQAEARVLVEEVRRRGRFLCLLQQRMEKARKDDPLYPAVSAAEEAVHTLWVRRQYRARGVDRPPVSAVGQPTLQVN
ncbi:MAG TPA: hypothetical protein VKD90_22955 [Gemmataceae bacterium]|nr:hypothetical protein [Gemmataceae bacterium]